MEYRMKDWPVQPYEVQKQQGIGYPRGICSICFVNYGIDRDNKMVRHGGRVWCEGSFRLTANLVEGE